jgi:hypothetical protein
MFGYYEDGPNLVTLAMNGWADEDPAWWLNLQRRAEQRGRPYGRQSAGRSTIFQ